MQRRKKEKKEIIITKRMTDGISEEQERSKMEGMWMKHSLPMFRSFSFLLFFFLSLILFISCSIDTKYHEYHDVDLHDWTSADTVVFQLPPIIESQVLQVKIGVKSTQAYPYTHLHLLGSLTCDGEALEPDSIVIPLYSSSGKAEGNGFPYIVTTFFADTINVDSGHVYSYQIYHVMSHSLKGIAAIGLQLSDVDSIP